MPTIDKRFQIGFGSLAPGEAVFDRYGMPIGFLRSWHIDNSRWPEVMNFSKDGHYDHLDPIITLELGQTCPQGKEVKVMSGMDLDLYEPDNALVTDGVPLSQFGRYAFGLDKLADGLSKAVALGAMTKDEASKEFRQFVFSIQKDEEKAKLITALEEKLAELTGDAPV